jgi:hypothetical protein
VGKDPQAPIPQRAVHHGLVDVALTAISICPDGPQETT